LENLSGAENKQTNKQIWSFSSCMIRERKTSSKIDIFKEKNYD